MIKLLKYLKLEKMKIILSRKDNDSKYKQGLKDGSMDIIDTIIIKIKEIKMDNVLEAAFGAFCVLVIVIISLVCYCAYTDEFKVSYGTDCVLYSKKTGNCIEYKKYYTCEVQSGETRYRCNTSEECNTLCEKERLRETSK